LVNYAKQRSSRGKGVFSKKRNKPKKERGGGLDGKNHALKGPSERGREVIRERIKKVSNLEGEVGGVVKKGWGEGEEAK